MTDPVALAVPRTVFDRPQRVLLVVALLTAGFAAAGMRVETDNTQHAWLPERDPARDVYEAFRTVFGGDTFLLVGVGPLELASPDVQRELLDLQGALAALPGVVGVRGPFEGGDPVRRAQDELPGTLELLALAAERAPASRPDERAPATSRDERGAAGSGAPDAPGREAARGASLTARAELDLLRAELGGSLGFLLLGEQPARALPLYQEAQRAARRALSGLGPAGARAAADLEAGRPLGEQALGALEDPQARRALFSWAFARGLEVRARLGDARLLADLPRVDAVMAALLRRDEALAGPHLYFALRRAAPSALGGDLAASRRQFATAARLQRARTGRPALLVRVLEARSLAPLLAATPAGAGGDALRAAQRRSWEAFAGPLEEVLSAPPPRPPFDAEDLAQEVAQRQAAAMLADPGAFGIIPPDAASAAPVHTAASVWTVADPAAQGFVADDGRLAGVFVFPAPDLGPRERAALVAGVEGALAASGLPGTLAGPEAITHDLDQASQRSFGSLFPVVLLVLAGVLVFALRSAWVVTVVLLTGGITALWTLGLLVLAGRSLNLIVVVVPAILVVVTTATALHLVSRFLFPTGASPHGEPWDRPWDRARRARAWRAAAEETFAPCLLTALTTSAGFVSLALSEIPPVRDLGLFAAAGVLVSFGLTFSFLPALLVLNPRVVPRPRATAAGAAAAWLERVRRYVGWLRRRAAPILVASALLAAVGAYGASRLAVESHVLRFFSDTHRLPRAFATLEEGLFGLTPLELWVSGPRDAVFAPGAVAALEGFLDEVRRRDLVTDVLSPLDPFGAAPRATRGAHARPDPGSDDRLGDGPRDDAPAAASDDEPRAEAGLALSASARVALLEASLARAGEAAAAGYVRLEPSPSRGGPGDAGGVAHLRITALCRTTSSEAFHALVQDLRARVPASLRDGEGARLRITGAVPLLVRVQDLLVDTQLRSFGGALALVTLALLLAFRALRPVLLSIAPNVLPILITLGAMGLSGIPLNTATVTVAGIALGLVVDDTIHLLHGIISEQRRGHPAAEAVARTLATVGRPVATTTAAVALGFGVFALSPFKPTHYFGLLIASTCVGALLCDLLMLPASILVRERGVAPGGEPSTIRPS